MISEIVKKEKERQEGYLTAIKILRQVRVTNRNSVEIEHGMVCHKQSLINLKEHTEAQRDYMDDSSKLKAKWGIKMIVQLKEDIVELNKMIERYKP